MRSSSALSRYQDACASALAQVGEANRAELFKRAKHAKLPAERTVLVTHERQFRLQDHLSGLSAHFFGHRHGFKFTRHAGTLFVNVSSVDPLHCREPQYGIIDWTPIDGFRIIEKVVPVGQKFYRQCARYYQATLKPVRPEHEHIFQDWPPRRLRVLPA